MAEKLPPLTGNMLAEALEAQSYRPSQRSWGKLFFPAMTVLFCLLACVSYLTPGWVPGAPIVYLTFTGVWFVLSVLAFKYA